MTTQINLTFFLGSHYEKFKANQGFYGGSGTSLEKSIALRYIKLCIF